MLKAKEHLLRKPSWQYIIFKYNEEHKEQAKRMALENDVNILFVHSARWTHEDDPLMPVGDHKIVSKGHMLNPVRDKFIKYD